MACFSRVGWCAAMVLACGGMSSLWAADPFAEGVRTTPHLPPAQEQKAFKLPAGFEIELVAAEPEIQKPLNMAFDAKGRIWLTDSVEYPYAAPLDKKGRDTVKVLEDTDGDGKYEKITTFADGMNIPIGIYPYQDGCLVFTIPNILFLRDTDGDGVCDERKHILGPFGFDRDTHGMNNAFRRGYDGWLYACHGFNNNTSVTAADGSKVTMNSGNTYRFRPDGSRIEQFTWGQVNPFGMCIDPLFNLFTADCHSKPVYQLLRGGYYPSFGKPDDGLGFVPPMMEHLHGSTAICGLITYDSADWPAEYQGNYFSGNVMTSRINRNSPVYHGSTIQAKEEQDFLSCEDPWFRPVDIQLGPDGAMYVLDFYNRIIGHYEVPLPHPGRDRTSGRIWKISYKTDKSKPQGKFDISSADAIALIEMLKDTNKTRRMLAADQLFDRVGAAAADSAAKTLPKTDSPLQQIHLAWLLERWGKLDEPSLLTLAKSPVRDVRVHAMKILSERKAWNPTLRTAAVAGLKDDDAFVKRAAADAIGRHPDGSTVEPLMAAWDATPEADNHLVQVIKMAVRDHISDEATASMLDLSKWKPAQLKLLQTVFPGSHTPAGGALIAKWLVTVPAGTSLSPELLRSAARNVPNEIVPQLVERAKKIAGGDTALQASLLFALDDGLAQRGAANSPHIHDWAVELCNTYLKSDLPKTVRWENSPVPGMRDTDDPWEVQYRESTDGKNAQPFFSSLPRGEEGVGVLRSQAFTVPKSLTFWCAGHSGVPSNGNNGKNKIRLVEAETGHVLAESSPPINDLAQKIEWKLGEHAGKKAYIEIADSDAAEAYAWLAVGRFSMPELMPFETNQRRLANIALIERFKIAERRGELEKVLKSPDADFRVKGAAALAVARMNPSALVSTAAKVIEESSLVPAVREKLAAAIADRDEEKTADGVAQAFGALPAKLQSRLAVELTSDLAGCSALLGLIENGKAAATVLQLPTVKQKMAATKNEDLLARADAIRQTIPTDVQAITKAIEDRRASLATVKGDSLRGAELFKKHCAICHQVAGQGAVIGPQLDGIGNRGQERLLEDLLDPNRNVDVAFRSSTIELKDGRIVTGLVRRQEGTQLVIADAQGKESQIALDDIEERTVTTTSLMPANVAEILPGDDFVHLIRYLLEQRQVREPAQ